MASIPTKPRTAAECVQQTAGLERVRVNDVRKLAILSSLRSNIVLHGSQVALAEHDAKRAARQRHHDLAVSDIAHSHDQLGAAIIFEAERDAATAALRS